MDATCAPADIAYPTDLGLLNDAREKSEIIIDKLYRQAPEDVTKPRTYRKNARKDFLKMSMKRKNSSRVIERYRERYGYYPESAHADKIYRTKANRLWCQANNIRLSGVPVGRPPKDPERNPARRKQIQEDERIRNAVEGKFGQAKRRFSLNWVMARLAESSKTVVSIIFLVMNLEHLLSVHFLEKLPNVVFLASKQQLFPQYR